MSMNVLVDLMAVILMQLATTQLEITHAHVTLVIVEMGLHAQVSDMKTHLPN